MAIPFKYVKNTNINMKVHGRYDADTQSIITIEDDQEVPRKVLALLSDFDGSEIDLSITNKDSLDLDEPESEDED